VFPSSATVRPTSGGVPSILSINVKRPRTGVHAVASQLGPHATCEHDVTGINVNASFPEQIPSTVSIGAAGIVAVHWAAFPSILQLTVYVPAAHASPVDCNVTFTSSQK
jgi:hypothetical protein